MSELAPKPDSFIEWSVRRSLPLLPADEANKMIVKMMVEIIRLEAELDAYRMVKEGK